MFFTINSKRTIDWPYLKNIHISHITAVISDAHIPVDYKVIGADVGLSIGWKTLCQYQQLPKYTEESVDEETDDLSFVPSPCTTIGRYLHMKK